MAHVLKIEHKMICIERRESATNCNAAKVLSNFEIFIFGKNFKIDVGHSRPLFLYSRLFYLHVNRRYLFYKSCR